MANEHPTAKGMWDSFYTRVVPKDAPAIQLSETRRAFYAGMQALLMIYIAIVDLSEDEGVEILEELNNELQQFSIDVLEGRA